MAFLYSSQSWLRHLLRKVCLMESHMPRFQSQLCYWVMWPWISHLTSLSVSSLEELEGTEKRKNKVFHLSLYVVTNPQFGLKQHFIIISHSSIGCLGSARRVSCGVSGAAVIWRLGTQDGSSNAWYLMVVCLWQLSWGCWPESLPGASPCGMSLWQYGGCVPWGNAPEKNISRGSGRNIKASYDLVFETPECHFCCIFLVKQITKSSLDAKGERTDFTTQWDWGNITMQKSMWGGNIGAAILENIVCHKMKGGGGKIDALSKLEDKLCYSQVQADCLPPLFTVVPMMVVVVFILWSTSLFT